jgi:hypothetical protein
LLLLAAALLLLAAAEHIVLRELLIRNFSLRYQKGQVRWLEYPDRKKMKMH